MASNGPHHAQTAHDCWRIAREHTEHFQKELNKALIEKDFSRAATCKAARDAADSIALEIRYGKGRASNGRKA
jgi:hypothetical protein